ncbi:hypothetical protein B5E77_11735 [Lachnoclostridium sp. An131]|uniref:efflux RND transporter periplasmic adaptor subunit n=1 Tax=Lachnoclostridium sp. An131 TaxID=1965555 RepID=UPI000B38746B|nr:efflux RND transporter periplasmic adaptor subunit [Lachnoclostridium sp. An131]OUQ25321.1 hypothetical protein B5E77_11735 [Lachnoclostridium sp. An131]
MKLWESRKKNQEGEELKELFQKETLQEEESSEEPYSDNGAPKKENPVLRFLKAVGRGIKGAGRRIGRFAKKHKILTVLIVLILIAAIVALAVWQSRSRRPQMQQTMTVETDTVERMDLTNSIGVTGTLATAEGKSGTMTLENIEVTAVYVEVGDEVQEGDIICTFDSSDIESALADAQNNYAVNQQIDALDNYETQYTETVEEAEESLQDARDTRDAYRNAYEDAVEAEEAALSALNEVQSQYDTEALKSAYDNAAAALTDALEEAMAAESSDTGADSSTGSEEQGESGNSASSEGSQIIDLEGYLNSLTTIPESCSDEKEAYDSAKSAYETAEKAISDAQTAYEQAQANSSSAYSAYEQAQSQKESVQEQYDTTVEQAQETYERAQLEEQLITEDDGLNQIESYEEQLEDCTVYASMTGTITALNVEEGGVFTGGTIYEIQDVHNFIVEATVDEYDVVDIEEGQTAYIVTDSIGDEELEGEVTYVSPVGTSGQTMGSASGTASYEIQITINEPQDKLRSGMTASVSIALEESRDTLAVPYDCVQTNEAGESVIYVDDNGERKEVVVETGIETDYYIEVSSDEISEGMTVYLSTPLVQSGTGAGTEGGTEEEGMGTFEAGGDMGGGMPSGGGGGMGGGMPSGGGGMGGF